MRVSDLEHTAEEDVTLWREIGIDPRHHGKQRDEVRKLEPVALILIREATSNPRPHRKAV
jgi:hypothetical protein